MTGKREKRIKAVFFDIDGTLISFKTHQMHQSTQKALPCPAGKGDQGVCGDRAFEDDDAFHGPVFFV